MTTIGVLWGDGFYFKVTMTTIGVFIDYMLTDDLYGLYVEI